MKKIFIKTISIFLLMAVVVSNLPLGTIVAGVRPSVAISSPSTRTVEEGTSVTYTVKFSYADTVNDIRDYINLNGFTANVNVSGSGDARTVTLSNVQGTAGKKTISIDAGVASNDNGNSYETPDSTSFTLVEKVVNNNTNNDTNNNVNNNTNNNTNNNVVVNNADKVRPSLSISSPSVKNVNVGGTVSYKVTFADNRGVSAINLTNADITLNGFTATVNISGTGNTRTITLSNVQGAAGKKSIVIKSGVAIDAAGNASFESPVSESFTISAAAVAPTTADVVRPSIAISNPSVKEVEAGGTVTYVITFADNREIAKVNLSNDYIVLNGFTADVKVTGEGNTRTITLSNIKGEIGVKCNILIKKGAAEDASGNVTFESPVSESFRIVKKAATPTTSSKLDNEPNTGVESLPVLPIMGAASAVLSIAGFVITKKIYG